MTKIIIFILSLSTLLLTSVPGQRRPTRTQPVQKTPVEKSSQPVSIQTATTKEGRTVLLKSDGTWEYSADPTPQPTPTPSSPVSPENSWLASPSLPPVPSRASIAGKWAVKFTGNNGQVFPATMEVSSDGEQWTATIDFGPKQATARLLMMEGGKFEVSFTDPDQTTLALKGTFNGSTIEGTMMLSGTQGGTASFVGYPATAAQLDVGTGNLTIQAGIVYRMGGPQPVARAQFYLLKRDLADILSAAGLRPDKNMNIVQTFGFAARYQALSNYARFYQMASQAIQPNVVATVTTDFTGIAQFVSIPAGSYYLMGYTQTRGGFALWNLPVGVTTGHNSIVLDQNNAAIAL